MARCHRKALAWICKGDDKLTEKDYQYLYGKLTDPHKKLPPDIFQKMMDGEDFTKEEECIIKQIIQKDREKTGV